MSGLAKVAAINCDEEPNKPFCGQMGVKGFPTLKIVRPGKKAGRPNVEDYQGPRTAKGIVEAVKDKIPNHVKRLGDSALHGWLAESNDTAKAILFTDKGTTSPLLKALAVDFLGSVSIAQIRDKETSAVTAFGVTSYPTFLLLPGGEQKPVVHQGELTKEALSRFLSQVAQPNPEPAPKPSKPSKSKSKDPKKSKSAASAFSKASASHESADSSASKATQTAETLESDGLPTESPNPNTVTEDGQKPVELPEAAPMIPFLATKDQLEQACLTKKSGTCILALRTALDEESNSVAEQVRASLAEIHHRHVSHGRKLFPFYSVSVDAGDELRKALSLSADDGFSLIAVNGKRSWVRKFAGKDHAAAAIENWVDAIRMGDGQKESIPDGVVVDAVAPSTTPTAEAFSAEDFIKVQDDAPIGVKIEEITPEMKEQLLKQASDAANKLAEDHDEL